MSRVLIVEDEEAIADLEKDYLELSGFTVGCFTLSRSQIHLVHLYFDLDMFLALKFGQ